MTAIKYSRETADQFAVLLGGSRRIGAVKKIGSWWLAITPENRKLGHFTSMSGAGKKLVEEDNKR